MTGMERTPQKSAWLAALLVAGLGWYLYRNFFLALGYVTAAPSDFSHYYLAAQALLHGASPYARYIFDYPPLVVFLMLPLALLPYVTARLLWFCLSHLFLAAAAWLLWRNTGQDQIATMSVVLTWSLCGTVAENLVLGQVGPLLLLLVVLAIAVPRLRALCFGGAAALKLWPAILMFGDLIRGRWKQLAGAVATATALVLLPLGLIAVATPGPVAPQSGSFWMGTPAFLNLSLPATVLRLADPPADDGAMPPDWKNGNDPRQLHLPRERAALSAASGAVTLALCLGLIAAASRHREPPAPALIGAIITSALAGCPIVWYHYQILQFPGIVWLASKAIRSRRFGTLLVLTATALGLTWAHRLDVLIQCTPWVILVRGAAVVLLDLVLLVLFLRQIRVHTDPPPATQLPAAG